MIRLFPQLNSGKSLIIYFLPLLIRHFRIDISTIDGIFDAKGGQYGGHSHLPKCKTRLPIKPLNIKFGRHFLPNTEPRTNNQIPKQMTKCGEPQLRHLARLRWLEECGCGGDSGGARTRQRWLAAVDGGRRVAAGDEQQRRSDCGCRGVCGPGSGDSGARQCAAEVAADGGDSGDNGWAAEAVAAGQRRRQCGLGSGDCCEDEGF